MLDTLTPKREYQATNVNLARLVMDEKAFLAYPWGRVACKNLIKSVKDTDLWKNQYYIAGFVQVLQVWIYMSLPDLGIEIGKPLPTLPGTPPILRFKGSRYRKYVKDKVQNQVCTCLVNLSCRLPL